MISGVCQGSFSGHLTFLIDIYHLPLSIESETVLYADDCSFIKTKRLFRVVFKHIPDNGHLKCVQSESPLLGMALLSTIYH